MLDERSAHILESAIREFIRSGEPVSSGFLYERHDFGIKPAMIRLELTMLTDLGFLEQAHHSAGRVPTNRGYEFFASRVIPDAEPTANESLRSTFESGAWDEALQALSRELGVLSVLGESSGRSIYKNGLSNLIDSLSFASHEAIRRVIDDFEALDRRVWESERMFHAREAPEVFVGRKSPVTKSDELSVMASEYDIGGRSVLLLAIGPKRMNYEKAAKTFQGLKKRQATSDKRHGTSNKKQGQKIKNRK